MRAALAIAIAGTALRALVWAMAPEAVARWEYDEIAHNILAGRGFGIEWDGAWYRSFGGAPFAYVCAFMYRVFGARPVAVLGAQWMFSAVTTLSAFALGRRLFSPGIGLGAAALVALHPGLLYYDARNVHALSFDAMLITAGALAALVLWRQVSNPTVLAVGLLHGVALFERNSVVGLPVASIAALAAAGPARRGRRIALYAVAVALVLAPWLARSVRLYGYPVITTTTWEIFWRGNNALSDGGSYARDGSGLAMIEAAPAEFRQRLHAADEVGRQKIFVQAAMDFITTHPRDAARLFVRKLWGFWWFMPQSGLLYPRTYLVLYGVYYVIVAGLAILGAAVALAGTARRDALVLWLVMLSVGLFHAVFYVEIRHRWGIEPLLLVFTAGGGAWALHAARLALYYRRS